MTCIDLADSVRVRPHASSPVAFIGFTGMQLYRPVPEYEWVKSLSSFPVSCCFVRDLAQFWYLHGLAGISGDILGSVCFLRRALERLGATSQAVFGASTGGYAALLFGSLLGVDEVHATVPMTIVPSRKVVEMARSLPSRNWRLLGKQVALRLNRALERPHRDLRPIMQVDNGRTIYHIYYGRRHEPDRRNAERLGDLPRVVLHAYDYNRHYLLEQLKASGELGELLNACHARLHAGA